MTTQYRPDQQAWPTTKVTLLKRIADSADATSWDLFVRTYGPLIMRYCCRRGLPEQDAADVVQDVLLSVSKGIDDFRYDPDRGLFRSWLGTVTHRAMLKHQSKSRRSGSDAGNSDDLAALPNRVCLQPVDEDWIEAFNVHIYQLAIERLRRQFDEQTWSAFDATFTEDRSPEEVAVSLKRTVGWVYQAKSKIVRQLKQEILYLAEDSLLGIL